MKNYSLFWMAVWGALLALAIAAVYWKPARVILIVIAAIFFILFVHDYRQTKKL